MSTSVTPSPLGLAPSACPPCSGGPPVDILGYPIVTVLAEKLCTAVQLGEANTRIRDYVDLYNLTGSYSPDFLSARDALLATAAHRGISLRPLGGAIGQLADTRAGAYRTYRTALAADGEDLPTGFFELVTAVTNFADPVIQGSPHDAWNPTTRQWS